MDLQDYFDFLSPEDIRIKGHRIGIEHILYEYIHRGQSPEQIAKRFETLSLEQIYATILYYLQDRDRVGRYVSDWLDYCQRSRRQFSEAHQELVDRMHRLKDERQSERVAP